MLFRDIWQDLIVPSECSLKPYSTLLIYRQYGGWESTKKQQRNKNKKK